MVPSLRPSALWGRCSVARWSVQVSSGHFSAAVMETSRYQPSTMKPPFQLPSLPPACAVYPHSDTFVLHQGPLPLARQALLRWLSVHVKFRKS